MRGLRTLLRLPSSERSLAIKTLALVAAIRAALWILPFRALNRWFKSWSRVPFSIPKETPVSRLVWAVRAASKRIPGATCLTQSLALHFLMTRAGLPSQIRIGVAKDERSRFKAHAWVEASDEVYLSAPAEVSGYVTLPSLEGILEHRRL